MVKSSGTEGFTIMHVFRALKSCSVHAYLRVASAASCLVVRYTAVKHSSLVRHLKYHVMYQIAFVVGCEYCSMRHETFREMIKMKPKLEG